MITLESAHFDENWMECLYVIEAAKEVMRDTSFLDNHRWGEEMKNKWIVKSDIPELEEEGADPPTDQEVKAKEAAEEAAEADRLMGKFEKWEDIRKHLWFHYTNEEVRSDPHTYPTWMDERSDED